MEEIIEETLEIDDLTEDEDFDSADISKWAWVAIGAVVAGAIGGIVMFAKKKLFKKPVEESEESETISIEEDIEFDEED